jgi:cell division protein FtsB|tara:strand:- start:1055 stop:1234 length:180 start_codon:yes stop_codon:yes gene_type:complete
MPVMDVIPVVELLIGSGIIGMLWKMNVQLASLTEQLKTIFRRTEDHESRIRKIERGKDD